MPVFYKNAWTGRIVQRDEPDRVMERATKWQRITETEARFDPSEYTVARVNAYLDGVDEAERDRVLRAESAGKGRTTILGTQ